MTDYTVTTFYEHVGNGKVVMSATVYADKDDYPAAHFHGAHGLILMNRLCDAIAATDHDGQHTITNGDTGQMTYGRLGDLLKD